MANDTIQRMRASCVAESQFGGPQRLAPTADGDRCCYSMAQQKNVNKRHWVGGAACCFLLAALMAVTLVASRARLSAALTTATFSITFLSSAILYLMRCCH